MKNASWLFVLGLAALLGLNGRAAADVTIQLPFGGVLHLGQGARLHAPAQTVPMPAEPRLVPEVVVPEGVTPPIVVLPGDRAPVPSVRSSGAPTLQEFATSFTARAGRHEVVVLHPVTGAPVTVAFSLPGSPRRVVVNKQEIVFRYGLRDTVRLEFLNDGTVLVK